jgi:DNA-binding IclR family transcriptional regulator
MDSSHAAYSGTQAIQRAASVLKALGAGAAALTPQELSQRTGLNRSTVYRLVNALEAEGLVATDGDGRYRLGPELVVLGGRALRQMNVRAVALPWLRDLARQTGETVDLEVLSGASVMIIEELAADHLLNTSSNIGRTYPATCAATGKALLAWTPPDALERMLTAELPGCGPRSIRDGAALRAELAAVRMRGYATSYEELEAHLHAVGAPIFNHQGEAIAAVSVSGPAARLPREREPETARLVMDACAAISERLGYRA